MSHEPAATHASAQRAHRLHNERLTGDWDDVSSISSSAPSIPTYESLRRVHLVTGVVVSPCLLCLIGLGIGLAWRAFWQEFGLGFVGMLAAETLRQPLAKLSSASWDSLTVLPLFAQAFIVEGVRLFLISVSASLEASDYILQSPPLALRKAVWLGLGAATAEIALRTSELLRQVHLYSDVLEQKSGSLTLLEDGIPETPEELDDEQTVQIIEAHLRARERLSIRESYGVGLDRIPGFLLVLWSVNSVLLSLGLSALLYLGYLSPTPVQALDPPPLLTWLVVGALHGTLSTLWVALLPSGGLAMLSFASFISLFLIDLIVLACWGALL